MKLDCEKVIFLKTITNRITTDESQRLDAQRHLARLQYGVIIKSSINDLSCPTCGIKFLVRVILKDSAELYDVDPKAIAIRVTSVKVNIVAFQHGF